MSGPPTPDLATAGEVIARLADRRIELFGMVLEAHNELLNATQRGLEASAHLPVTWLGVLIRLARSPGERLRMTELARDMTMSTSGLTRLVDRIEAAGLVRREPCRDDRRGLLAGLTDEGRSVLATAAPCHLADLERHLDPALSEEEQQQLITLLRKLRDHVRASAP